MTICFHCGLAGAVFACGQCRRVHFCGPSCQKGGWKRHRPDCFQAADTCSGSSGGSLPSSASPRQVALPTSALLHVTSAKTTSSKYLRVYPNAGALQGEIDVEISRQSNEREVKEALRRVLFRDARPLETLRIFTTNGMEVRNLQEFWDQASKAGVVVSAENRPFRGAKTSPVKTFACKPRFSNSLIGSSCCRLDASDPEVESLLRAPVPVVISNSNLAGEALNRWSFAYLERHLADVDNFFVLCSPEGGNGRFSYYDFSEGKNPCGYKVVPNNTRVEMRFPEFRKKLQAARGRGDTYYLQNTLLHREERETGRPRPVGRFGKQCGYKVAKDIDAFRWEWLKNVMGQREPQMCQLFCGSEGFSPCHYDPQDNLFLQVTGYKRVLLFHPRHFGCLYPWPVHHPQDRQSRVDFEAPDLQNFPRFAELKGKGIEAILEPGDVLHIPPGWWHQVEMLPSPQGEVVSFNFWYPPPTWFDGDLTKGEIHWDRPLFGVRRTLFQRCVEELVAQVAEPSKVHEIVTLARSGCGSGPWHQALEQLETFLGPVLESSERQELLADIVEGRFVGLG